MGYRSRLVFMVAIFVFGMFFAGCSFRAEVDVDTNLFSSKGKDSAYLTAPSSCGSEDL